MKKIYATSVVILSAISISFLISSCGGSSTDSGSSNTPAATTTVSPGEAVYKKTCITCHQANGEGLPNTYPPLAKSDFISDKEKTIRQVLKGFSGELVVTGKKYNSAMPAQQLNDDEIAAVLTYVYSNFGNTATTVTADEVKAARAQP